MRGDILVTGSKYAYVLGRVKALEANLITKTQFNRMVEASSSSEAAKVLSETVYGDVEGADVETIEKILLEELKHVYDLVQHISPEREFTDLLQLKYDFHNVKAVLKSETVSREPQHLVPLGVIDIDTLKRALEERLKDLPPPLAQAVEKARHAYEKTGDTQVIDFVMDSEYTRILREHAEKSPFLKEFVQLKIDLENIRNFMRSQRFNLDFTRVYLEGGTISLKTFENLEGESPETVANVFSTKDYYSVVEEGLKDYENTQNLAQYEKLSDDFLMEYIRKAKLVSLGIEPLIGYILAKEMEIKQIRLILLGKLRGVEVGKRVSDPYV